LRCFEQALIFTSLAELKRLTKRQTGVYDRGYWANMQLCSPAATEVDVSILWRNSRAGVAHKRRNGDSVKMEALFSLLRGVLDHAIKNVKEFAADICLRTPNHRFTGHKQYDIKEPAGVSYAGDK
jgi:hypothetical protein